MAENPLRISSLPIRFDAITAAHVAPAVEAELAEARQRQTAIEEGTALTFDATFGAFDRMTEGLERTMGVAGHLESVATTPELRDAYNEAQPKVSEFSTQVYLSAKLYERLRAFAATPAAKDLSPAKRRFIETTLADFRRAGAALDAAGKTRLAALEVELSKLALKFSQNVLDATNAFELIVTDEARLAGLPPSAIESARESAKSKGKDGYRFTLQAPSYIAVMTYADDRALREAVYRAHSTRGAGGPFDNRAIVRRMLELRAEKAKLVGFSSFPDLVLDDRMAKTGAAARAFVRDLEARTRPFFEKENQELAAFCAPPTAPAKLEAWDVAYHAEKLRRARFDFDEEALRPYFSLDGVMEGLFTVASKLYGVRIEPWADASVWHADVRAYRLFDGAREIGAFYADLYPRESKRDGAWMHGLVSEVGDAGRQVALIAANVSPPVGGKPALLTHREVETMFHEFGHLMHHMLSKTELRSQAGTNVAWDFVELPSQIMENWTWDEGALALFARHHETGATIAPDLFKKMQAARTFRAANQQMRQLGFAEVDLSLHTEVPGSDDDVLATARAVAQRFSAATLPPDYAMIASFGHLFSSSVAYAAGYYSYKWAEVLDADAFSRFREHGVLDAATGDRFRRTILERGSSEDPMALYVAFMGRPPEPTALFERNGLI